jgi:hypothetical protein
MFSVIDAHEGRNLLFNHENYKSNI